MSYLHDNNIIHRGLNPYIISIKNESGDVLISDFGLSTKRAIAGTKSIKNGHPEYIAPEQYENSKTCTKAADVYAFGMIALCYLFAEDPYIECENSVHQLYTKISQNKKEPDCMGDLITDENIIDFVRQCIKFDPDERLTVQQLLEHEFLNPLDEDGSKNAEDLMVFEDDEDDRPKTKEEQALKAIQGNYYILFFYLSNCT